MNNLIEQFKRDAVSFEEKLLNEWVNQIDYDDLQAAKAHFITTALNLITKMIEECEKRKKEYCKEDVLLEKNKPYDWHGYSHAISDTISQLKEFKEWLEKEIK